MEKHKNYLSISLYYYSTFDSSSQSNAMNSSMQEPFIFHLLQGYRLGLGNFPASAELIDFVKYLIEENLISDKRIREYMLLQEFKALYRRGEYRNKSETVRSLARKYDVSESSIWHLLKQQKQMYAD